MFGSSVIVGAYGYDGSHYGTHDWIADAALRSLRDPIKNPLAFNDWVWLLNSEIARNKWPGWNPNYGNSAQHHNKIRGYYTFLFASQMPDMRIDPKTPEVDLMYYPQMIEVPQEGVVIEDFYPKTKNMNKWVGQIQQHSFHFQLIDFNGVYGFSPYRTLAATKVKQLGEAAIKCIGNKVKDDNDIYRSAMQPEGAAGWLGAMTHYIADLVVPAHLLEHKHNSDVYHSYYHTWFENQLGSLTKWDKSYTAHGGPENTYFSWDISKIGKTGLIIPIPPEVALTSMAVQGINIAYRTDGNHQHIEYDGNNNLIARNSGLYLNSSDSYWDWKEDLDTNGRIGSPHKYFYDKVENLLCWATYFIACAMQYCLNEGKERLGNDQGINPDYYVTRNPDDTPRYPPYPDPQRFVDEFLNRGSTETLGERLRKLLENIGMLIAPIITVIIALLGRTFHLTGR